MSWCLKRITTITGMYISSAENAILQSYALFRFTMQQFRHGGLLHRGPQNTTKIGGGRLCKDGGLPTIIQYYRKSAVPVLILSQEASKQLASPVVTGNEWDDPT